MGRNFCQKNLSSFETSKDSNVIDLILMYRQGFLNVDFEVALTLGKFYWEKRHLLYGGL